MEEQPEETGGEEFIHQEGLTGPVSGKQVNLERAVAGSVSAEQDVTMTRSVAGAVSAGNDLEMSQSRAFVVGLGRDLVMSQSSTRIAGLGRDLKLEHGSAVMINAGGQVDMDHSQALVLLGTQVTAQNSRVGVLLSPQTALSEGSQVLLDTPRAVALGAAVGAIFALVSWLLRRK